MSFEYEIDIVVIKDDTGIINDNFIEPEVHTNTVRLFLQILEL